MAFESSPDVILDTIGLSKYQMFVEMLLCLAKIPAAMQVLVAFFIAHNPPWKCKESSTICNMTGEFSTLSESYKSRCNMPRSEWEFTRAQDYSVTTQFDLVCDKEILSYILTSMFFIAWGAGSIPLGWVADKIGRFKVFYVSFTITLVACLGGGFANSYGTILISRIVNGFFFPGLYVQIFIFSAEIVGPKWRPTAGIFTFVFFSLALVMLGVKAYFIRQWKNLMIVISAPYFVILGTSWFIPESLRWLRLKGKTDKAIQIIDRITRSKGKDPADVPTLSPLAEETKLINPNPLMLFKPFTVLVKTLLQCFIWLSVSITYYGITLASDDLSGNMYRDYILSSLGEFPACLITMYTASRFGRKRSGQVFLLISSISCVAVSLIPLEGKYSDLKWLRVTMGIIGKSSITASFNLIYVWSAEIFPTIVRSQGMGLLQLTARIGAAAAPWVAKWLGTYNRILPFAVMGAFAFLSIFAAQRLPETKGVSSNEEAESCKPTDKEEFAQMKAYVGDVDGILISEKGESHQTTSAEDTRC